MQLIQNFEGETVIVVKSQKILNLQVNAKAFEYTDVPETKVNVIATKKLLFRFTKFCARIYSCRKYYHYFKYKEC